VPQAHRCLIERVAIKYANLKTLIGHSNEIENTIDTKGTQLKESMQLKYQKQIYFLITNSLMVTSKHATHL
jgi:hypothetical protein